MGPTSWVVAAVASMAAHAPGAAQIPPVASPVDSLTWFGPAQLATAVDSLELAAGQVRVDLSHAFVVEILELTLDGAPLRDGVDVTVVADRGFVALARPARGGETFVASYRFDPASVSAQVQLHVPSPRRREEPSPPPPPHQVPPPPAPERAVPGALRISGSKSVSVQGGTNRDATVDQALRLTVTGQLTEGIGVRAEISDENLPITPEGNTEELADLDQVRIELFGDRGRVLLGDFQLSRDLGTFVPYERKLQGLWLQGRADRGVANLLGGAPRGRRVEVELRGREGVQGPYELLDGLRLDQSFIVAGSERVWVDGEPQVRGEGRDYVIDYVRGTITFTERRPVGPENRLAIDFETSATGFRRSVVGAMADSTQVGPLRLRLGFVQEADDPERPIEGDLSAADRDSLAQAGDDPLRALGDGVVQVESGQGNYVERFTMEGVRFFEFADSTGGDFDVTFLRVGEGEGDYVLDRVTEGGALDFDYVGPGNGDYRIGRRLALPAQTQIAIARLDWGVPDAAWLRAEANATRFDANQLSRLDDDDNDDVAWRLEARSPWFGSDTPGRGLRATARAEAIGGDFRSLGRIREPFFYEAWNLQDEARTRREGHETVALQWVGERRSSRASWQRLQRLGQYDGSRATFEGGGSIARGLRWDHRLAFTAATRPGRGDSRRRDRRAGLSWRWRALEPHAALSDEEFTDARDDLHRGYRSDVWRAGLRVSPASDRTAAVEFSRELADSLQVTGGRWRFARDVRQWKGRVGAAAGAWQVDGDVNWRTARRPGDVDETTRIGRVRLARRPREGGLGLDLDYRAGTEQSRVLGRQIVFVGFGQGDYDAEGNRVGVRQGDYNVVFTPSDSLVSTTNVEVTGKIDWTAKAPWVRGLSSSSLVQVRERSRAEDRGAVLRLSPGVLRDPDTTLFGEERWREELVLLRDVQRFDLRLTYDRSEVLDQRFTEGPQKNVRRQRQARLESDLGRGFTLRVELGDEDRRRDTVASANPLLRGYDVADRSGATTLRYRASARTRVSLLLRYTERTEASGLRQSVSELVPSATLDGLRGRWTLETRWAEVAETGGSDATRPFFFERPGTGRSANVQAQWGIGASLTVSLRYQVRDEPDRELRQNLALETRARF